MTKHDKRFETLLNRRKFSGLMALYDQNFHLLNRLIPDLAVMPERSFSAVEGSPELYLEKVEQFKFTTTLQLTYYFRLERGGRVDYIADPDLLLRVYHDAQVVEVMSCRPQGFMAIDKRHIARPRHLHCRWDSNLFLHKWLEYLVEAGHLFTPETAQTFDRRKFETSGYR